MSKSATRNAVRCGVLSLMVASASAWAAQAKGTADFPARPIRIVVGFTPGGQPDIFSRMIGTKLTESLRQPIVVDNRPGAGGAIGTKIVAEANPDGHTLLGISASHVISPAVRKLTYDTVGDFAGVTVTYNSAYLLVVPPSLGVKTVKDLVTLAQALMRIIRCRHCKRPRAPIASRWGRAPGRRC